MIQKKTFPGNGYVLHKITGNFKGECSAWFDNDGNILDAERHAGNGRVYPVEKNALIWNHCQTVERIHK